MLEREPDEYALREVLNYLERAAFMVREGFLSEKTFDDLLQAALLGWWYASEAVIQGGRERMNMSTLFEHIEWVIERLRVEVFEPDANWIDNFSRREAALPFLDDEARADPRGSDASS